MTEWKIKLPDSSCVAPLLAKERKNLESQIREIKSQLKFFDKLFSASLLSDFLFLFYTEVAKQFKVRSLIFCWRSGHFGPLRYVCHSKRIYKESCNYTRLDEQIPEKQNIRIKHKADMQYWANSLGRPVQNILSLPVYTKRFSADYPCYIFVEYFTKDPEKFLCFYKSYSALLTKCLDRLLWQDHLETGVELLTSTFNELNEPLAIFDEQNRLSSANSAFNRFLEGGDKKDILKDNVLLDNLLQWNGRVFEKHSYPVVIKRSKHTIYHYVDISKSLELRTRMIQNMKMSALGELGEAIAHRLNNPLTGALSMAEWLLKSAPLSETERKDMEDVVEGISRSQEIITNLLDFSRADSRLSVCDLNKAVQKTVPFLKSLICFSDFHIELSEKPVFVQTQACLLRQVIFNLLKNACQAVSALNNSPQTVKARVCKKENQAILLVEDSGMGISSNDYENVFKPFFTTKSESQGTGLGLSMSKNVVESFGGSLTVGRSLLGGACFTMSLPLKSNQSM